MTFDPIERWNLTLCAGAIAAGLALVSPLFAWSLAAGAALEAVNFRGLRGAAQALFAGQLPGSRRWTAAFGARFALLALGIGVAIHVGAHPVGLVIGLSLVIPAAIIEAWRTRPEIDPDAPALAPDDERWDQWNPWLAREIEPPEETSPEAALPQEPR
jgi:hypothetical protein